MSIRYSPVKWNRNKRVYDLFVAGGVTLYLAIFVAVSVLTTSDVEGISFPVLLMRAFGSCALLMLHAVLAIGPLARLDRRFLPLVYNRRHLGVATFLVGFTHAIVAVGYYHGFGVLNPLASLLSIPGSVPFEWFGLAALAILFLLAATSHDFWQKAVGPSAWKWLHMLVYLAYALLILHVLLGALRSEPSLLYPGIVGLGFATVAGLHLTVGLRERRRDVPRIDSTVRVPLTLSADWIDVGSVDEIPYGRAKVICLPGRERVAVFRYDGCVAAVTNVCAHQRGPLGDGKIVDGCISCPWHGWEYRPEDGCSPPPFQERLATYRVRIADRRILLDPTPNPPGTPVEPARFLEDPDA